MMTSHCGVTITTWACGDCLRSAAEEIGHSLSETAGGNVRANSPRTLVNAGRMAYQQRPTPGRASRTDVTVGVSNHPRAGQVDAERYCRPQQHAGRRLATGAWPG